MGVYPLGTYVYLKSLRTKNPEFAIEAANYSTFKNTKTNDAGEEINIISTAISTLSSIAAGQAQIEHQAIQNYIRKIDQYIAEHGEDDIPTILLNSLKKQKESIKSLDFETYNSDNLALINAINVTQQNLTEYKQRLNQITNKASNTTVSKRTNYHIQTRVEDFLLGKHRKQSHIYNKNTIARDEQVKERIKQVINKNIPKLPPEFSQEITSLIFIDFNAWVERNQNKSYMGISLSRIDELFSEYEEGLKNNSIAGQDTHLQRIIKQHRNKELLNLAQDLRSQLGAKYISNNEYQQLYEFATSEDKFNENNEKIQETRTINKITYSKRQAKNLVETYNANIESEGIDGIYTFNFHTATSHGNFLEFLKTVLTSAVNVSGNVATDIIIPFGTLTGTLQEQKQQQKLMKLASDIDRIISKDFATRENYTIDNFKDQVKQEQSIMKEIKDKLQKTGKALKKISEISDQFFIAHESLKLYKSSEIKNDEFESFHGRKMNILSALSKLYASPILANDMIDSDMLITYLLNIYDATLVNNKNPLELYLSLFAGLLMFDDIKLIAETGIKSVQQQIQTAKINQIHLYNVDGIYIPISIILKNLINELQNATYTIDSIKQNSAIAVIQGASPADTFENTTIQDWSNLSQATISKTTIQIHFLAGFTDLINNLFHTYGK